MEYSIDSQTKRTILGNTTILMLEKGMYIIQMFGNDIFGTMSQLEIKYLTIKILIIKVIMELEMTQVAMVEIITMLKNLIFISFQYWLYLA
ncbi:MAG: hypothetical protein ACFFAN_03335 [Promethearchaeota archaeon]